MTGMSMDNKKELAFWELYSSLKNQTKMCRGDVKISRANAILALEICQEFAEAEGLKIISIADLAREIAVQKGGGYQPWYQMLLKKIYAKKIYPLQIGTRFFIRFSQKKLLKKQLDGMGIDITNLTKSKVSSQFKKISTILKKECVSPTIPLLSKQFGLSVYQAGIFIRWWRGG